MPPEDMTLMYAAAKGISRSNPEDLSLALFMGIIRKPMITNRGRKARARIGKNPKVKAIAAATMETGNVKIATKNIKET
jgi:hypothetical protein